MQASMSDWRTETPCKASEDEPIIYLTKITKTKVIPLYRLANNSGESQDIICFSCDSQDPKTLTYSKKVIYPAASILSVKDEIKTTDLQMSEDMIHNCMSLGISIQDGPKDEGWKQFSPIPVNPCLIPLDDLTKYYKKTEETTIDDISPLSPREEVRDDEPIEPLEVEELTEDDSQEKPENARVVEKVDPSISVTEHEPSFHFVPQPKGQRGRPRKVYDDPEFDALVRSIPHSVPCKGCGKDIILVPLNVIDRARVAGKDVSEFVLNYRCRSCKV